MYERIPLRETKNPNSTPRHFPEYDQLGLANSAMLVHVQEQCSMKLFMESVTHPQQILQSCNLLSYTSSKIRVRKCLWMCLNSCPHCRKVNSRCSEKSTSYFLNWFTEIKVFRRLFVKDTNKFISKIKSKYSHKT